MDESYIHQNYCSRFSWFFKSDDDVVPHRVKGNNKGKRLIIIHAMSKDGMLDCEPTSEVSDNMEDKAVSASVVTAKLSAGSVEPEDYHDTLDGAKFLAWMENRLLPSFVKKYGCNAKMVLILDNAKYHHVRGADWVTPSKMTKWELGAFLRYVKVKKLTVFRKKKNSEEEEKIVIAEKKFTADLADGGLTRKELLTAVQDYVRSHPQINTTLVQQLMDRHGHQLLYTPPYESWLQPIELIWAKVKHKVATQAYTGRSHHETAAQTREALRNITAEYCQSLIEHTHKLMDEWIQGEAAGSLRQFQTVQAMSEAKSEQLHACTDLTLPDWHIVGDAAEEKEKEETEE